MSHAVAIDGPAGTAQVPVFFADFVPGRRGQILDAALAVFSESGYVGGTMRDIAERVGVTEPALYRHFAGKQELYEVVTATGAGRVRTEALALLDGIAPDDIRASLLAALADRRSAVHRYMPLLRLMMIEASYDVASLDLLRTRVIAPIADRVVVIAERVDAHFGLDRSPEERAAATRPVMSMFVGTIVTSVALGDTPDEVVVEAMVRIMGWE